MHKCNIALLCCALIVPGFTFKGTGPEEPIKKITAKEIKKQITFLASDKLKGRDTPSPGLDSAAVYIAGEFKKSNVAAYNGNYLQQVNLVAAEIGTNNIFNIRNSAHSTGLKIKEDFIPFLNSGKCNYKGKLVFAGYGITAQELSYDDYKDIDVKGKLVVVFKHVPGELSSSSPFKPKDPHNYYSVEYKTKNAKAHGAAGILLINDPLNHLSIKPIGFSWTTPEGNIQPESRRRFIKEAGMDEFPVVDTGEEFANAVFGSVDKLKEIQNQIDEKYLPKSFEIENVEIDLKIDITFRQMTFFNVIGMIEGSDPDLKKECVIIGAHYDHKGVEILNASYGNDNIYIGADDNASGTAAVIAIAKEFASLKTKPKRSIVFVLFGCEEKGGYGSMWYAKNPIFPVRKSVAMINLDMISRNSADSLNVGISTLTPELIEINDASNKKVGFKLQKYYAEMVSGGSDHQSFNAAGIPVIYFFAGIHKDYHTVTDEVQNVNSDKAARVAKLAYYDALSIANDNRYYKHNK